MKSDIKKLWIKQIQAAKELSEYGELNSAGVLDPAGILCDIHRKRIKKAGWKDTMGTNTGTLSYMGATEEMPEAVWKWAGLDSSDPQLKNGKTLNETWDDGISVKALVRLMETSL